MPDNEQIEEVLAFWFGELDVPTDVDLSKNGLWWKGAAGMDAEIQARFGALVALALAGELHRWATTARGALALVILLDQFTRTIGRGSGRAFAGDAAALKVCEETMASGLDRELRLIERCFLCMPMMHAEDPAMARRSVEVFGALSEEIRARAGTDHPDFSRYADNHAEIVARFGRYPHRNELIGRASTPEEEAYLADGAPSFGQKKE